MVSRAGMDLIVPGHVGFVGDIWEDRGSDGEADRAEQSDDEKGED